MTNQIVRPDADNERSDRAGHGRTWGSIGANVAHSYVPPPGQPPSWQPPVGDVVGAVFWPVALFVALEILTRTAWPTGWRWVALRFLGMLPVALVAAIVSYNHLSSLLAHYRESTLTSLIGPLAVDGLMVMASASLMATAPGRGTDTAATVSASVRVDISADASQHVSFAETPAPHRMRPRAPRRRPRTIRRLPGHRAERERGQRGGQTQPDTIPDNARTPQRTQGRGRSDTSEKVAALVAIDPEMSTADIAKRLNVSDRTVRRHLAAGKKAKPSARETAAA
jgi:Sigma-70, region 4